MLHVSCKDFSGQFEDGAVVTAAPPLDGAGDVIMHRRQKPTKKNVSPAVACIASTF